MVSFCASRAVMVIIKLVQEPRLRWLINPKLDIMRKEKQHLYLEKSLFASLTHEVKIRQIGFLYTF